MVRSDYLPKFYNFTKNVKGPQIWSTSLYNYVGYDIGLNETLMVLAGFGLFANIYTAYSNVKKTRKERKVNNKSPLWGLLPLIVQSLVNVLYANGKDSIIFNQSYKFSPMFLFLIQWGLGFSHLVGLIILGHVAKTPFPNIVLSIILTGFLALDSNLSSFGL